jgi:hypothetical protein
MERLRGEAIGFPAYRQAGKALERRSFLSMGNHRWHEVGCLHMVGDPESNMKIRLSEKRERRSGERD